MTRTLLLVDCIESSINPRKTFAQWSCYRLACSWRIRSHQALHFCEGTGDGHYELHALHLNDSNIYVVGTTSETNKSLSGRWNHTAYNETANSNDLSLNSIFRAFHFLFWRYNQTLSSPDLSTFDFLFGDT